MRAATRPNVIFFMVDQMGAKWLEAAMDGICQLPNLRRLQSMGVAHRQFLVVCNDGSRHARVARRVFHVLKSIALRLVQPVEKGPFQRPLMAEYVLEFGELDPGDGCQHDAGTVSLARKRLVAPLRLVLI